MPQDPLLQNLAKPGYGYAWIGQSSKGNPIDNMMKMQMDAAKERQTKSQKDAELKQKGALALHADLKDVKNKIFYPHLPEFQNDIQGLLDDYTKADIAGLRPYDPTSPASFALSARAMDMETKASASKGLGDTLEAGIKMAMSNPDKFDYNDTKDRADFLGKLPLDEAIKYPPFMPTIRQVKPEQVLGKFEPELKQIYGMAKVYSDKGNADDVNKQLDLQEPALIQRYADHLETYKKEGQLDPNTNTVKLATDFVQSQRKNAMYDPYKVNALDQKKDYQDAQIELGKERVAISKIRADVYDRNSLYQQYKTNVTGDKDDPIGLTQFSMDVLNGNPEAIQRMNTLQFPSIVSNDKGAIETATSNKDAKIVNGDKIPNVKLPGGQLPDPNKKYVVMTFDKPIGADGKDKDGQPINPTNTLVIPLGANQSAIKQIAQSVVGNAYALPVLKKTATPYINPEYAAKNHKQSATTTHTVKTSTSTKHDATTPKKSSGVDLSKFLKK